MLNPMGPSGQSLLESDQVRKAVQYNVPSAERKHSDLPVEQFRRISLLAEGPKDANPLAVAVARCFIIMTVAGLRLGHAILSHVTSIVFSEELKSFVVSGKADGSKARSNADSTSWPWLACIVQIFDDCPLAWLADAKVQQELLDGFFLPKINYRARSRGNIYDASSFSTTTAGTTDQYSKAYSSMLKIDDDSMPRIRYDVDSVDGPHAMHSFGSNIATVLRKDETVIDRLATWSLVKISARYQQSSAFPLTMQRLQHDVFSGLASAFRGKDPELILDATLPLDFSFLTVQCDDVECAYDFADDLERDAAPVDEYVDEAEHEEAADTSKLAAEQSTAKSQPAAKKPKATTSAAASPSKKGSAPSTSTKNKRSPTVTRKSKRKRTVK